MLTRLLIITALCAPLSAFYSYGYQTYPDRTAHSHPFGHPGANPTPYPNQTMQQILMASLLNPAPHPQQTGTFNTNFQKAWQGHMGNDMINQGAIQQNVSCRADCRRQSEDRTCGSNMTLYFNECDAQCDEVTYSTENLRYNSQCCCTDEQMSLDQGKLTCVLATQNDYSTASLRLVLNQCLTRCLTLNGDSLAQDNDMVSPC